MPLPSWLPCAVFDPANELSEPKLAYQVALLVISPTPKKYPSAGMDEIENDTGPVAQLVGTPAFCPVPF